MNNETDAATAQVVQVAQVAADFKRTNSDPNCHARLLNKQISIKGQNGTTISGVLRGFSRYNLLMGIDGGECILVSKGAVLFLSSPELVLMKAPVPEPAPTQAAEQPEHEFRAVRCR
jgi:hypothetical protein